MKKLKYSFVKSKFEEEGCKLLSKVYINNMQKLDYICSKGHKHSMNWNNWNNGQRCPYCNIGKRNNNIKLSIEFVKLEFKKEKCILLSKSYINSQDKLDYICSNGHKHSMTWANWQQGRRCSICRSINISGSNHPNWQGGISCEPYCDIWLDKDFKESIKERDNYRCQNPDCWHKKGKAGELTIHHVDYNKKNCGPENLITLCRSCNFRANYNRDMYKGFYGEVIRGVYC